MSNTTIANAAIAVSRNVTVFCQQGKNNNKIEFNGATWTELKDVLRREGYNIDSLSAVESTQRHELSVDDAIIPTVDFYLHLYPVDTKSGAAKPTRTKAELVGSIKDYIAVDGADAKTFFAGYSSKKVDELEDLLKKYGKKSAAKAKKATKTATKAPAKTSTTKAPKSTEKKTPAKKKTAADILGADSNVLNDISVEEVPSMTIFADNRDTTAVQAEHSQIKSALQRRNSGRYARVR